MEGKRCRTDAREENKRLRHSRTGAVQAFVHSPPLATPSLSFRPRLCASLVINPLGPAEGGGGGGWGGGVLGGGVGVAVGRGKERKDLGRDLIVFKGVNLG